MDRLNGWEEQCVPVISITLLNGKSEHSPHNERHNQKVNIKCADADLTCNV